MVSPTLRRRSTLAIHQCVGWEGKPSCRQNPAVAGWGPGTEVGLALQQVLYFFSALVTGDAGRFVPYKAASLRSVQRHTPPREIVSRRLQPAHRRRGLRRDDVVASLQLAFGFRRASLAKQRSTQLDSRDAGVQMTGDCACENNTAASRAAARP